MSRRRRVVITGIGPVTPIGVGARRFWANAIRGQSGVTALTKLPGGFNPGVFRSRLAAGISDDLLPRVANRTFVSRQQHLGELAARLALWDAGLVDLQDCRAAVVAGTAVGATEALETSFVHMSDAARAELGSAPPELSAQLSFHTLAAHLAHVHSISGPSLTVSTGCTAGLDAIATAFDLVARGDVERALAGAADAPLTPVVFAAFDVIGALSGRNDSPAVASRPFDRDRDGFVLAEGAAFVILEELSCARARGARVYAEIRGTATVSNGYHMTDLPPDGAALADCIRLALNDARVGSGDVDVVNAHASSTPQNDICETNAVKKALRAQAQRTAVNGLKSMIGHALGASNAIEIAACALMLRTQRIFPTINIVVPGPGCDLDYVAGHARFAVVRNVLKLSNGFSGIHSAMVLAHAS